MEAKKNCEEFLVCYSNKKEEKNSLVSNSVMNSCKKKKKDAWGWVSITDAPLPQLTSARRSQTPEVTPRDAPPPEMMGLALPGISLLLVMHWSHLGARSSMAQNRSWPRCGLLALMVSCIRDCITTRNRFLSSLKTVYFGHLPPALRDVFISQKV